MLPPHLRGKRKSKDGYYPDNERGFYIYDKYGHKLAEYYLDVQLSKLIREKRHIVIYGTESLKAFDKAIEKLSRYVDIDELDISVTRINI